MLLKRKSKNSVKNLYATLQVEIDPLLNKLEYMNNNRPPNLVYPMYLSPPSSCYQRTSKSLVFTSFPDPAICPIPSAKLHRLFLANLQNFPSSKTLSTLWKGGLCLGTNLLSMYDNGRGKENRLQWFLTKDEQLALSKRWVCCVVETYLGFSL